MSKMVEVTNLTSPKTGSQNSIMALWNTCPPRKSGTTPEAAAVASPVPKSPRADGGCLAQLEPPTGQVADCQCEPGGEAAGKAAARQVVPGEEKINGEHDHGVEDQSGHYFEDDRAPFGGARVRPATSHASRLTSVNFFATAKVAPSRESRSTPVRRPTLLPARPPKS